MYLTIKAFSKEAYWEFYKINNGQKNIFSQKKLIFDILKIDNCEITFFKNLTILIKYQQIISKNIIEKIDILLDKNLYIGSDEVGTGENIGPMVVCALMFENINQKKENLINGTIDSKKLNADKINLKAKFIEKKSINKCIVLEPKNLNILIKKGSNIKEINSMLHNKLHLYFREKYKNKIIVDEFVNKKKYLEYLNKNNEKVADEDFNLTTKGEEKYLEIAGAAIIAKSKFNDWIVDYMNKNGFEIPESKKINSNLIAINLKKNPNIDKNEIFKEWYK